MSAEGSSYGAGRALGGPNMTPEARSMLQETYYPGYTGEPESSGSMTLDSLADPPPGAKPRYPYSTLIRYAIKGSPHGRLLLEDIYYALETRFPYFKNAPSGWKNSVRHNLSLNPCFIKVPRPLTDRGKGSYWALDESVDPRTGVHRIRKKRGGADRGDSGSSSANAGQGVSDNYISPYQYMPYMHPGDPSAAGGYAYGWNAAFMPPEMRYDLDPADPSAAAANKSYYRDLWLSDISRLEEYTKEMETKGEAGADFWRMMYMRLYRAFAPDPPMYATGIHDGLGGTIPEAEEGADDKEGDDMDDED